MVKKEDKLCAPRKDLSDLTTLGEAFVKAMRSPVAGFKEAGRDTTTIDKLLTDLSKRIGAHKRALKL